jgi:cellulose synthase/poly-beta-1,6-N-acetylglucosamine synthase-like glycosyltransferase
VSDLLPVIVRDWHLLPPIGVVGALSRSIWLIRKVMSARYRPTINDFRTTSVVVPSFREDPDVLERCLGAWLAQRPTEVLVVLDVEDTEVFARLAARGDDRLTVISFPHEYKRSALGVGIRAATDEVLALCDPDTLWRPRLLSFVQMPFADPTVGAVSTRRNVYLPRSSTWRRVADWIIDLRYLEYVPATSRAGAVVCVSRRTAAYRRSAVLPVLEHLEHEFFLGRRCIAGDDGRLIWLVLASGYETVHESSARPVDVPQHLPRLLQAVGALEPQLLPLLPHSGVEGLVVEASAGQPGDRAADPVHPGDHVRRRPLPGASASSDRGWQALGLSLAWVLIGRAILSASHLRRRPRDLAILPLVAVVIVLVALPTKTYALFPMNKQGRLTRRADLTGGEGQDEANVVTEPAATVTA